MGIGDRKREDYSSHSNLRRRDTQWELATNKQGNSQSIIHVDEIPNGNWRLYAENFQNFKTVVVDEIPNGNWRLTSFFLLMSVYSFMVDEIPNGNWRPIRLYMLMSS